MAANLEQANAFIAELKQALQHLQKQNANLEQQIADLNEKLNTRQDKFYDC